VPTPSASISISPVFPSVSPSVLPSADTTHAPVAVVSASPLPVDSVAGVSFSVQLSPALASTLSLQILHQMRLDVWCSLSQDVPLLLTNVQLSQITDSSLATPLILAPTDPTNQPFPNSNCIASARRLSGAEGRGLTVTARHLVDANSWVNVTVALRVPVPSADPFHNPTNVRLSAAAVELEDSVASFLATERGGYQPDVTRMFTRTTTLVSAVTQLGPTSVHASDPSLSMPPPPPPPSQAPAIAGGVVGGIVGLALLAAVVILARRVQARNAKIAEQIAASRNSARAKALAQGVAYGGVNPIVSAGVSNAAGFGTIATARSSSSRALAAMGPAAVMPGLGAAALPEVYIGKGASQASLRGRYSPLNPRLPSAASPTAAGTVAHRNSLQIPSPHGTPNGSLRRVNSSSDWRQGSANRIRH
jgi:hypothetical protein